MKIGNRILSTEKKAFVMGIVNATPDSFFEGSRGGIERALQLIEEGAENLKTFSSKIDTDKMKAPSFLMVLTGTGNFAYRRKDGVYVVPIGCLKN